MLGAYGEILKTVARTARGLRFKLVHDEEYFARFQGPGGWSLEVEGDRAAYPGFTLFVSPAENRTYAVWLLMQCFELPAGRAAPTLENQLWFLKRFARSIFQGEAAYQAGYARLNEAR
jgi:hypothetical protein